MVYVPDEKSESVGDLAWGRDDLVGDIRRYKLRIHHFLLRHGHQYIGKSRWTDTYRRWVRGIKFVDTTLKSTGGIAYGRIKNKKGRRPEWMNKFKDHSV